jgi:two-component system chemotaxis response regulator CheY
MLLKRLEKDKEMAKILLADDAAFMRMTIKNALAKEGYTDVHEAADGLQAVEQYNELKPDLVFMDITMPNMDGLEALKAIKSSDANAKVIMCSAMGQEAMVIDAVKSGAKDFIVKPFKPDRIIKAVKDMGL